MDSIGTLLATETLADARPSADALRSLGIPAVFRVRKITVGSGLLYKLNFSPAAAV